MATEFQALQKEALATQQSLLSFMRQSDQLKAQIHGIGTIVQMKRMTLKALEENQNAPVYRAVGKCYAIKTRENLVAKIQSEITKGEKDIGILTSTNAYAERRQKEMEDKLADVLKNMQAILK